MQEGAVKAFKNLLGPPLPMYAKEWWSASVGGYATATTSLKRLAGAFLRASERYKVNATLCRH